MKLNKEEIVKMRKAVLRCFKEGDPDTLCHWVQWDSDKKNPVPHMSKPCYAFLYNAEGKGIKALTLVVNQHKSEVYKYAGGYAIPYLTWLMKESPWASAFKNKSPRYALKHGFVMNPDAPFLLVHGAAIAVREVWEFPEHNKVWKWLVDMGINPAVAHVMNHNIKFRDTTTFRISPRSGHSVLQPYSSMLRYVKNDPYEGVLRGTMREEAGNYHGSSRLFFKYHPDQEEGDARITKFLNLCINDPHVFPPIYTITDEAINFLKGIE